MNIPYLIDYATRVSTFATCKRRKVGAVFAIGGVVYTSGFNSTPKELPTCMDGGCPRGKLSYDELQSLAPYEGAGACISTHAEVNCIEQLKSKYQSLYAKFVETGYVFVTHKCCMGCFTYLHEANVSNIICQDLENNSICLYTRNELGYSETQIGKVMQGQSLT